MEASEISPDWPNPLRWCLAQRLRHFTPWHFITEPESGSHASHAFSREDTKGRRVFVFAYRQDCDDFAGVEVIDGRFTDRVLCFHPSFGTNQPDWEIVDAAFDCVFDFLAQRVIPDMKDWASTEDASDLTLADDCGT